MALDQLNTYINIGNSDLDNLMFINNKLFQGHQKLSLTNMANTTVAAIEEGSIIEIGGTLFSADGDESISTTDPHTSTTVADGQVYIFINAATGLAYYTATAPTWDAEKQGYYGTGSYSNYKYVEDFFILKSSSSYTKKLHKYILSSEYVSGRLSDGTPYAFKEINITFSGTLTASGAHGISNAYTSDRIFKVQCRLMVLPYIPINVDDTSSRAIHAINWDNTNLTIVKGAISPTPNPSFDCKIWYTIE